MCNSIKAGTIFQFLLWLAYPAIIFFGLHFFQPRSIAVSLALLLIIRWRHEAKLLLSGLSRIYLFVFSALLSITAITCLTNNEAMLRIYPASVSLGMLLIFGYSLKYPPTIVERFARLQEPNLTISGMRYTRNVTKVWCIFFVINGCIATYTAIYTSREIWSLYNGLIAYILMGAIFAGEWLLRRRFIVPNTQIT